MALKEVEVLPPLSPTSRLKSHTSGPVMHQLYIFCDKLRGCSCIIMAYPVSDYTMDGGHWSLAIGVCDLELCAAVFSNE